MFLKRISRRHLRELNLRNTANSAKPILFIRKQDRLYGMIT